MAVVIANAAAEAVERVGLPEARINLAHATVHLAQAPKSNRAYSAINEALADVRSGRVGEVPLALRDASASASRSMGAGDGYIYPHDDRRGWTDQQYLPDDRVGHRYYRPSTHGFEAQVGKRLAKQNPSPMGRTTQAMVRTRKARCSNPTSTHAGEEDQ